MPKVQLTIEAIKAREYWTPSQAAQVMGRSGDWWRAAFDDGRVFGYQEGRARYISAASARELLAKLSAARTPRTRFDARAAMADFRRRVREELESQGRTG